MYTFLWHDYETFGPHTQRDRPAQFAAIRTDAALNEIGMPLVIYCRPAPDFLPDPESCLITGITPQLCLERGLPEYQFAAQIEQVLAEPNTIGVGYNTIRFDDEITRFMFWRNLIDPYAREWQHNCGRWDLLDVMRATYALRPQGIIWPRQEDGSPSFKLEHLCQANGIHHETAHDALSDVRATIACARLVRTQQPRLFDFCLALHKKERVATEISLAAPQPFLHISGMFPAKQGCLAIMWPLAAHPFNKNQMIAWNLSADPKALLGLDAETIQMRCFSKVLPPGMSRLPIKMIHLNKSPIVISQLRVLSDRRAAELGIDIANALRHADIAAGLPDMDRLWHQVYQRPTMEPLDVDEDLYSGFIGGHDRRQLTTIRGLTPTQLAGTRLHFEDTRLEMLLFRYRARNFHSSLTATEIRHWEQHCIARLRDGHSGARTIDALSAQISQLFSVADERGRVILSALRDYAKMIVSC